MSRKSGAYHTSMIEPKLTLFKIDNAEIMLDSFIENKKNIDIELKQRGKDCGCYYQAWSKSYLYMGLLGMGMQSNASRIISVGGFVVLIKLSPME